MLGGANRARATLDARRRELLSKEGRAEFAAEFALLGQAVTGALAAAESPEACDDQLARLLIQLENLESRFAEFDDFLAELAERRTEVYEAFSARKQTLQDERARRAERLAGSADRVLETIARRVAALDDLDAVHTYFASDPMVAKIRRTADELRELGDPVRAEELDGRLKAARQEAGRALRDRTELYADGGSVIKLGRHRFAVNTQPFDLTLVPSGESLVFALTGTDYRAPVTDPAFSAARPYWEQLLLGERRRLPRRAPRRPAPRRARGGPAGRAVRSRTVQAGAGVGRRGVRRGVHPGRPRRGRHRDPGRPAAPARGRRAAAPRAGRPRGGPALLGVRDRGSAAHVLDQARGLPGPGPRHFRPGPGHRGAPGGVGVGDRLSVPRRAGPRRRRVPLRGADHRARRVRRGFPDPDLPGSVPPGGGPRRVRGRPRGPRRRPGRPPAARGRLARAVRRVHGCGPRRRRSGGGRRGGAMPGAGAVRVRRAAHRAT